MSTELNVSGLSRMWARLRELLAARRLSRDVAHLDAHLLRDIGLEGLRTRVANDDLIRAA